jgi:hypothetical protein
VGHDGHVRAWAADTLHLKGQVCDLIKVILDILQHAKRSSAAVCVLMQETGPLMLHARLT